MLLQYLPTHTPWTISSTTIRSTSQPRTILGPSSHHSWFVAPLPSALLHCSYPQYTYSCLCFIATHSTLLLGLPYPSAPVLPHLQTMTPTTGHGLSTTMTFYCLPAPFYLTSPGRDSCLWQSAFDSLPVQYFFSIYTARRLVSLRRGTTSFAYHFTTIPHVGIILPATCSVCSTADIWFVP